MYVQGTWESLLRNKQGQEAEKVSTLREIRYQVGRSTRLRIRVHHHEDDKIHLLKPVTGFVFRASIRSVVLEIRNLKFSAFYLGLRN